MERRGDAVGDHVARIEPREGGMAGAQVVEPLEDRILLSGDLLVAGTALALQQDDAALIEEQTILVGEELLGQEAADVDLEAAAGGAEGDEFSPTVVWPAALSARTDSSLEWIEADVSALPNDAEAAQSSGDPGAASSDSESAANTSEDESSVAATRAPAAADAEKIVMKRIAMT